MARTGASLHRKILVAMDGVWLKRVIITGASGFVGSNLARRLLYDGHQIHLLVRPGYTRWRIEAIRNDVHFHETNLEDQDAVTDVVDKIRPDWVFHFAAHGAYSHQTDLSQIVKTNILGTINLVEACLKAGFEAFVNTGSSSEYGFKDHAPSETDWLEPNSHYAVTKAAATLFCRYTAQSRGVHLPTLRLYSVYGPYEEPTRLMPTLILRGLAGELPPLVHPEIARDYVYIEDVNDAYLLAAIHSGEEPGAIYNVATGTRTTLREVVEVARRLMSIDTRAEWGSMPERVWDTSFWVGDIRKIQKELEWKPRYTFEQGFLEMIAWFQEDTGRVDFYRSRLSQ